MGQGWTGRRVSLGLLVPLGLAMMAAAAPASAQSQPTQNETTEDRFIEDWTLRCRPATESQPRTCRMVQNRVASEGAQRLLQPGFAGAQQAFAFRSARSKNYNPLNSASSARSWRKE